MKEIFANSIELIINKFVLGIPNFIMAIIIALLGFMVAKFVSKVVEKLLKALNIDRVGEMFNSIDFIQKNNVEIKISKLIGKFIYYILILIFLIAATDILQMPVLSNLVKNLIEFIPNLIVAIALIVIGLLIADKLRDIVHSACDSLGIPSGKLLSSFIFYFVFITVFIMALSQAKIDTDFLSQNLSIIIAGVVLAFSIGYGIASMDVVANYIAGFNMKGKYNIGDKIEVDGIKGIIHDIDKVSISLTTEDGITSIPINSLVNKNVTIFK